LRTRSSGLGPLSAFFAFWLLAAATPAIAAKSAALVVDANSGKTLYAENANARRYPASLTKMMTLYVLFEELKAGRLSLDSKLTVSKNAAAQSPSKLGLRAGSTISVENAILSLTTKSANDMAVAVAENVSGSVPEFAERMNRTARKLGMRSSHFRNPHGLPDGRQVTTARDLVKLAQALQDRFPTYYRYFGVRTFTFKGKRIRNHNRLLGSVEGVDGIKTGYTRASGFNLVTNVRRDGRHIIAVVMGGKTAASRDARMRQLIATYLPKAKRGRGGLARFFVADDADEGYAEEDVAEPTDAPEEVWAAESAIDVRLPRARPALASDIEIATAAMAARSVEPVAFAEPPASAETMAAPQLAMAEGDVADGNDATERAKDPIAARISSATEVAERAVALNEAAEADAAARLAEIARARAGAASGTASAQEYDASSEDGWHIQIGAVPTLAGAEALLEDARDTMGQVLASVHPLTQPVQADGGTLYRARFAGFAGKDEARAACAKLKSKAISCLAVPN
jgi:D-alanyl-D-alanine carboxypeptidase